MSTAATDRRLSELIEAGLAAHRAGRLDAARGAYERVLAQAPRHADALHLLGVIAMQQQRYADALDLIGRAIEICPQSTYFDNLGSALRGWGKLTAAAQSHEQAIALDPANFRAYNNFGSTLQQMRLPAAAAVRFREALALNPDFAEAHSNLGNVLREFGEFDLAEKHCRRAIALSPEMGEAHNNLGNALKMRRKLDEAAECYLAARRLLPHDPQVPLNLGIVRRETGQYDAAVACFREALALRPSWLDAWSNLLFTLSFAKDVTPERYLDEARTFGRMASQGAQRYTDWRVDQTPGAPLRIGFVSGDLRTHPVGFFLESVVARLDPARVTLYAYATRPFEDALTQRLKPRFAAWRSIAALDDDRAAALIREDGIHILVDLAGHTDGNRLTVFARKPAPVQASWLGYFASTGLAEMDYVLGDERVLPAAESHHFVERPWRLGRGYLCFTPPAPSIGFDAGTRTREAGEAATFGSFGDLVKMNDDVVAVWSRILLGAPGARLFLKAQQLDDPAQRTRTLARFAAHGIEAGRLILEGSSPRAEYLAAYNRVDLTLSTFPYPGGTTTAESLWMGVPVLCRRGDRFLGHLCESVIGSVGLDEWIAADDDDYVAKAIACARRGAATQAARAALRERVLTAPLCDAGDFARTLEAAFQAMWQAHRQPRAAAPSPSPFQAAGAPVTFVGMSAVPRA